MIRDPWLICRVQLRIFKTNENGQEKNRMTAKGETDAGRIPKPKQVAQE